MVTQSLPTGPGCNHRGHLARPRRRKPVAYLGQVCVAADGPVTLRRPAGARPRHIFGHDGRKRSLGIVGDALRLCLVVRVRKTRELYPHGGFWGACRIPSSTGEIRPFPWICLAVGEETLRIQKEWENLEERPLRHGSFYFIANQLVAGTILCGNITAAWHHRSKISELYKTARLNSINFKFS
jgi:hypothetical protein